MQLQLDDFQLLYVKMTVIVGSYSDGRCQGNDRIVLLVPPLSGQRVYPKS